MTALSYDEKRRMVGLKPLWETVEGDVEQQVARLIGLSPVDPESEKLQADFYSIKISMSLKQVDSSLKTLNLRLPVTYTEVKSRYRSLAKQVHPDSNSKENSDKFIELKRAYDYLLSIPNLEKLGKLISCEQCNGNGRMPWPQYCTTCDGRGSVRL